MISWQMNNQLKSLVADKLNNEKRLQKLAKNRNVN